MRIKIIALVIYLALPLQTFAKTNIAIINKYAPTIVKHIDNANSHIIVVMYLITYKKQYPKGPVANLLNALIRAHKRGVSVEVILDKNNDYRHTGKEDLKNQNAFNYLKKANINVKYDSLTRTTHSKVLVIDKRYVVIGSTNWSYSALVKNHETSLLIDSKKLAQETITYLKQ